MSKLPVVSGAECVKALGKIGFEVYRQRGSHFVLVRKSPPTQTTIRITKSWTGVRYALSFGKPVLLLKSSWGCFEIFAYGGFTGTERCGSMGFDNLAW